MIFLRLASFYHCLKYINKYLFFPQQSSCSCCNDTFGVHSFIITIINKINVIMLVKSSYVRTESIIFHFYHNRTIIHSYFALRIKSFFQLVIWQSNNLQENSYFQLYAAVEVFFVLEVWSPCYILIEVMHICC